MPVRHGPDGKARASACLVKLIGWFYFTGEENTL